MFNLITIKDTTLQLADDKNYGEMVKVIEDNLPTIKEASSHFGKSQSQFMDNFLTVSHPTPIRNARQTLAELQRILGALREAQFKHEKNKNKIARLEHELLTCENEFDRRDKEIEIAEIQSGMEEGRIYIEGAVRAATNYINQYNEILKAHGIDKMSEAEFEAEEEKYHIMKAFDQAICAARARGGLIDEGNHIYFSQIGINGAVAQLMITKLFEEEQELIKKNVLPDGFFQHSFLENAAKTFKGCSDTMAKIKKISPLTTSALIGQ